MEQKKNLYIMHVPWAWIKQRPHFFAESLNKDFDLKVFFKRPLKVTKKNLINQKSDNMSISSFFIFPFQRVPILKNIKFLNRFNDIIVKYQLPSLKEFDYIWVTSWSMYSVIHKILPSNIKLIYDCMDDELEFPHIKDNHKILKEAFLMEKKIMSRADVIFCSSEYLKNKIINRSGIKREITVVNNAIAIPTISSVLTNNGQQVYDQLIKIDNVFMYVGAISSWFDFESVIYALEKNPLINFVLLGPKDVSIPIHSRLHHLGTVDRVDIFKLMENVRGLVMPFKLNELIKSVNPVKLYEYIYMSKPIISTRYLETEQFSDYIYLYNDKEEFSNRITGVLNGEFTIKRNSIDYKDFALENTWDLRYETILKEIK
jgi:hypothetical protein